MSMTVYDRIKNQLPPGVQLIHRARMGSGDLFCIFRQKKFVKAEYFDSKGNLLGSTSAMMDSGLPNSTEQKNDRPKDSRYVSTYLYRLERVASIREGRAFQCIVGVSSHAGDKIFIGDEVIRYRSQETKNSQPGWQKKLTKAFSGTFPSPDDSSQKFSPSGLHHLDRASWEVADKVLDLINDLSRRKKEGTGAYHNFLEQIIEIVEDYEGRVHEDGFSVLNMIRGHLTESLEFLEFSPLNGLHRAAIRQVNRLLVGFL